MRSLPIFETVQRTFGFVVERRFFSLLRLVWLPTFLSFAVAMVPMLYQFSVLGIPPTPEGLKAFENDQIHNWLEIFNFAASLILGAMVAISVHRMILLDDRQPGMYFYWRLTREEWLYVLAGIVYFILVVLFASAPIAGHFYYVATQEQAHQLAAAFMSVTDGEAEKNAKEIMKTLADPRLAVAGGLALVFALIALARFGLVFPIIVAEGRLSFWRSWTLTRGNTLQLIGFWIVVFVLAYLLIALLLLVFAFAVAGIAAAVIAGGKFGGGLGVVLLAVPAAVSFVVYFVVGVSIFIAAMSFSYKALAEPEDG